MFKHYLNLSPAESQFYNTLVMSPWGFKLFYGLIADNLPIFGSRRRAYVMLNGGIQSLAFIFLVANYSAGSIYLTCFILFITSVNSAFLDVVVDAMMVSQSKSDSESGSEDLQGLSWALLSIGGIIGSIVSAFFTEYLTPAHTFALCAVFSLVIVYSGYHINPEVENYTCRRP